MSMLSIEGLGVSADTTMKTTENTAFVEDNICWESLYDFWYNYEGSIYMVNVYRQEVVEQIGLADKYQVASQFKLIAYDNKDLVNGVEYVTEKYKWEITFSDYDRYKNPITKEDIEYKEKKEFYTLINTMKKDKYLEVGFNERTSILDQLKDKGVSHFCYDCLNTCKMVEVCRFCKGKLIYTNSIESICLACNGVNSKSLVKNICVECKGENYESVGAFWANWAYSKMQETYEDFQSCTSAYNAALSLLTTNWNTSTDEEIEIARKLKSKWEDALKSYNDTMDKENNSEEQEKINRAVEVNIQQTKISFSKSETTKLINKYSQKVVEMCTDSIKGVVEDVLGDTSTPIVEVLFSSIMDCIVEDAVGTLGFENDQEELEKYIDSKKDKYIYLLSKKINEEAGSALKEHAISTVDSIPKGVYFSSGLSTLNDMNSSIEGCLGMVIDCLSIVDDLSNYYKAYDALLNGKYAQQRSIKDLCYYIGLAATMKNILDGNCGQDNAVPHDIDGDNDITATDALLILQASVGKVVFTENQKLAGDVNGDGELSAPDALLVLQYSVKKITKFPVEG